MPFRPTASRRVLTSTAVLGLLTTVPVGAVMATDNARPDSRASITEPSPGTGTSTAAEGGPGESAAARGRGKGHGKAAAAPAAKNVILLVGDGMGAAHRDAGRLLLAGLGRDLYMDSLPVAGLVHTSPQDPGSFVTDSAASATAYATGVKTFNGAVGVDPRGNAVPTLLEQARAAGKATGIVTTSQVTDATGAAFGAHVSDRGQQSLIASQYLGGSRPDVILGGGEDWWLPQGTPGAFPDAPAEDPTEGSRSDRGNLLEQAQQQGYDYVNDLASLQEADGEKVLGLFANQEMFQQAPEGEGDVYDPVVTLPQMAQAAIDTLSADEDGFFLVVEEEAIDEFAHANNAPQTLKGVDELDKAVLAATTFARQRGDTLVVATADHETGGLAVEGVEDGDESGEGTSAEDGPLPIAGGAREFTMDWTTTGHTNVDVPLTAYGPGSGLLTGTYENTYVHDALTRALLGR